MTPDIERLMRVASLVLTLPVVTYASLGFYRNAWRDLRLDFRKYRMRFCRNLVVVSASHPSRLNRNRRGASGFDVFFDSGRSAHQYVS